MKTRPGLSMTFAALAMASLAAQAPAPQGAQGATAARGRGAAAPAPAAPAAGSPGTYKVDADLIAVLKRSIDANGDSMATSNIANTDQYSINIVHRSKGAGAIAHPGWTEVHHIMDGSATFVTGGTIVRSATPGAVAEIQGGVSRRVAKGDVVVIPENSPHWYKDVDGTITYLEIRFLAPKNW